MSRLVQALRTHRHSHRQHAELDRAIANAATPALRDELVLIAQRDRLLGPPTR